MNKPKLDNVIFALNLDHIHKYSTNAHLMASLSRHGNYLPLLIFMILKAHSLLAHINCFRYS